jgi:hypothetical protein
VEEAARRSFPAPETLTPGLALNSVVAAPAAVVAILTAPVVVVPAAAIVTAAVTPVVVALAVAALCAVVVVVPGGICNERKRTWGAAPCRRPRDLHDEQAKERAGSTQFF